MGAYRRWGKRALDLVLVVPTLPMWTILWAAVAVLVRSRMGRPVHFRQLRPGERAKPFSFIKLRTMTQATGLDGNPLSDEQRLVPMGKHLRAFSLDEVPTLWHVLVGDMSLVGPRPLLVQYLGRYSPEQARRHEVKPGITGWAQVHGRNALSWEDRLDLDVWYVDNVSLGLDLRILMLTVWKVLKREGVSANGHATMPEFRGNEPSSHA